MKNLWLFVFVVLLFGCSRNTEIADESDPVLVQVADRTITVSDYIKRAELTMRPFYCRGNTDKDKHIILNSLIAEKLLALGAGDTSGILKNPVFQAYIRGRKEQMMRDKLYEKEAKNRVDLTADAVDSAMVKTGMVYELEFINLTPAQAEYIRKAAAAKTASLEQLFEKAEKKYNHTARYLDNDLPPLQKALFNRPLQPGTVLEPVQIDSDRILFVRIKDYTYQPVISGSEKIKKHQLVKEQLELNMAQRYWDDYVNKIMHGKRIQFDRGSFEYLLELFAARTWGQEDESDIVRHINEVFLNEFGDRDNLLNRPFFKIDEEVWTIGDFRQLVLSHPIVFRDDYISTPRRYVKAFRTAVIDVIQDHFVNRQAYKAKLDRLPSIVRKTQMWRDALVAQYYQEQTIDALKRKPDFDPQKLRGNQGTYVDMLVDSLKHEYKSRVRIDKQAFEKIKLDNTTFIGLRPGVPYPSLVPAFPAFSMDDDIGDYAGLD